MIFVGMRIYIYISPTRLVSSFSSFFFFKVSIFISYTKYENTSEHDASTN
jgi:hypothetical protein